VKESKPGQVDQSTLEGGRTISFTEQGTYKFQEGLTCIGDFDNHNKEGRGLFIYKNDD